MNKVTFSKGTVIYREGDAANQIYRIVSGSVRCTRLFNKKDVIEVGTLGPGACCGLISVMRGCPHIETAIAAEDTELEVYRKSGFENLVTFHSDIALQVLTSLSWQIRELNDLIKKEDHLDDSDKLITNDEKLFSIGEYFYRADKPLSAGYVFSRYLELFPDGAKADRAQQLLALIRELLGNPQLGKENEQRYPINTLDDTKFTEKASRIYEAGEVIFCEYEPGIEMFCIEFGKVKVIKIEKEVEKVLAIFEAGEIFGEMAILDGGPRSATVVTAERTKVTVLTRANFERILTLKPDMGLKLIRLFCGRLAAYTKNYPHLFQRYRYSK